MREWGKGFRAVERLKREQVAISVTEELPPSAMKS